MSGTGQALVVGGSSGIGAAVVEAYRAQEVPVLVWDIAGSPDVHCDVSDPSSVDDALEETLAEVGVPNRVTITAGVGHSGMLLDESVAAWDTVMATNTRGPWLVMRAMARAMIESSTPASIIATSSVSAHLVDRSMGL
ncbi:MAG TPA: SDR family NAD(P)-dependent oxidoreductase, partial [Acidimicrobiales bacterium]|nr:SDR family NAD(P)-dependent oxidoreductase [Acidimicrobiales bacterium]